MQAFIYISILLCLVYVALMLLYKVGWVKQSVFALPDSFVPVTKLSVIIPARNEEDNIAACIMSVLTQDYPKELLEIIVVDDHSDDRTVDIVKSFAADGVRYINLATCIQNSGEVIAYKKQALATGIKASSGEVIITTDADCTAGVNWLKNIAAIYEREQPVMIVAPVAFTNDNKVVEVFQSLDFMSMQGITAATIQLKLGNMCNGANLAFKRGAYEHVNGYKGIDHIASGDDYLLMTKLAAEYPGRIEYLKSSFAIVNTAPQPDWNSFLQQRIRWASKSGKYDDNKLTAVLMFVYLFNLSFLPLLVIALLNNDFAIYLLAIGFVKTVVEIIYLLPVATFFNKRRQLWVFPLLQPLHIGYIILAGLLGFVGVYKWKGRNVR